MRISAGNKLAIGLVLVLIAAGSRVLPHWHNFTAVGATGLFSAYFFRKQLWAFLIPLAAMWVSDLLLNNWIYAAYNPDFVWVTRYMVFVYLGLIAMIFIGQILMTKVTASRVLGVSALTSLFFFLISNFGSFVYDPMYPKTAGGLGMAYIAGLPFFWNTLFSNIAYSLILFGVYHWISSRYPAIKLV